MSEDLNKQLLNRIRFILELINDGRINEVELSPIRNQVPDIAANIKKLVDALDRISVQCNLEAVDMSIIIEHLSHITKTTESGVLAVLNTAESIMNDCNDLRDKLDDITKNLMNYEINVNIVDKLHNSLDSAQNKCFSILTALEFEDINRQLMERITNRLDKLHSHLLDTQPWLKNHQKIEKKDSEFLESLKHIIDLEDSSRKSQQEIDDLFEDFSA